LSSSHPERDKRDTVPISNARPDTRPAGSAAESRGAMRRHNDLCSPCRSGVHTAYPTAGRPVSRRH
jgi:hypothetical protein